MEMGYFVVFSRLVQKNIILPASWIQDIARHYEKFLNNSLNHSQVFLCFYPEAASHAFDDDGCPDKNFKPDFHSTSCFMGKLKRYYGE